MQQEHVLFLHPTFASSTFKTTCSVLPITNNFRAIASVVGHSSHSLSCRPMKHLSRAVGRNRNSYSLHCALISVFLLQGKVKRERHPRERERHQHPREKEETALLSALLFHLPNSFQVTALCADGSTHCESMESFSLLRGLDFVCQQPQRKLRAGEEQSKSHHAQVPRKNKYCWVCCTEEQLLDSQQDRHPSLHTCTHTGGELVTPALPFSRVQALSFGREQQGQAGGCPWAGTMGAGSLQLQELQ